MLLALLVLDIALAVLAVAIPPGRDRPFRRSRVSPGGADTVSDTLRVTVADALSANPRVATAALAAVAAGPARFVPVLPTALSLLREISSPVRLVAAHAARAILAARPELLGACWPDPASAARRAVVSSIDAHPHLTSVARGTIGSMRRIIEQATRDSDAAVRRDAYARLSILEPTLAVDLAAGAMTDPDEEVQRIACEMLGQLGDAATLELLVERLVTIEPHRRPSVLAAVSAIGQRHFDELSRMARTSDTPAMRAAATEGLGATGFVGAAAVAATMLHDQSKELRRAAAAAIADVARIADDRPLPPGVVDHLMRQVERERSSSAMLAILDAIEACHAIDALGSVLRALPAMNPGLRERAFEVMATVQHPHD